MVTIRCERAYDPADADQLLLFLTSNTFAPPALLFVLPHQSSELARISKRSPERSRSKGRIQGGFTLGP